jgi:hypothetical protein
MLTASVSIRIPFPAQNPEEVNGFLFKNEPFRLHHILRIS